MNVLTSPSPNRMRVAGQTPSVQRIFDVVPGDSYELTYTQSENNSVSFIVEQSSNGTTWGSFMSSTSANGAQTKYFTPTQDYVQVRFSSGAAFSLANMQLIGTHSDTSYSVIARGGYRYGFQNQEVDDEVSGKGNSYTAEFWQYSPRIGRRWNIDPVVKHHESPYATFANNPILLTDANGADTSNYQNTINNAHLNQAMDLALKSGAFRDFLNSFASSKGTNFDIKVDFKSVSGLKSSGSSTRAEGQCRLMYNNTWVKDVTEIPENVKLEDFSILVEFNSDITKGGYFGQGVQDIHEAFKTVVIVHELAVHANSAINFLNSNRIKDESGKTTGINNDIFLNYKDYITGDGDHESMKYNKAVLYNKCSSEIMAFSRKSGVISKYKIGPNDDKKYKTRDNWSLQEKYDRRYLFQYEILDVLFGADKNGF